eukprot:4100208-Pyramimonas_sp.AAC.1
MAPRGPQKAQDGLQDGPTHPKMLQDSFGCSLASRMAPGCPPKLPGEPQESSKRAPRPSKRTQEDPETPSKSPKIRGLPRGRGRL